MNRIRCADCEAPLSAEALLRWQEEREPERPLCSWCFERETRRAMAAAARAGQLTLWTPETAP